MLGLELIQMMTSSNGSVFRVTGPLLGKITVTRSFDSFLDLRLNKQLSKLWRRRWFETQSCSLWRHCNAFSERGPRDYHGLYSLSDKTPYSQISWNLKVARFEVRVTISLWLIYLWQESRQHCCQGTCQLSKRYGLAGSNKNKCLSCICHTETCDSELSFHESEQTVPEVNAISSDFLCMNFINVNLLAFFPEIFVRQKCLVFFLCVRMY